MSRRRKQPSRRPGRVVAVVGLGDELVHTTCASCGRVATAVRHHCGFLAMVCEPCLRVWDPADGTLLDRTA